MAHAGYKIESKACGFVEVPVFTGDDLRPWLDWMENRFLLYDYTDLQRLAMAHGFIYGEAEAYIHQQESFFPSRNWQELKKTLLLRFGKRDDPERIMLCWELDLEMKQRLKDLDRKRANQVLKPALLHRTESTSLEKSIVTDLVHENESKETQSYHVQASTKREEWRFENIESSQSNFRSPISNANCTTADANVVLSIPLIKDSDSFMLKSVVLEQETFNQDETNTTKDSVQEMISKEDMSVQNECWLTESVETQLGQEKDSDPSAPLVFLDPSQGTNSQEETVLTREIVFVQHEHLIPHSQVSPYVLEHGHRDTMLGDAVMNITTMDPTRALREVICPICDDSELEEVANSENSTGVATEPDALQMFVVLSQKAKMGGNAEMQVVKLLESSNEEKISVKASDNVSFLQTQFFTSMVSLEKKSSLHSLFYDVLEAADKVEIYQHWIDLVNDSFANHLRDTKLHEQCKQERRKMSLASKSWMFKFKQGNHHEAMSQSVHKLMDERLIKLQKKEWSHDNISLEEATSEVETNGIIGKLEHYYGYWSRTMNIQGSWRENKAGQLQNDSEHTKCFGIWLKVDLVSLYRASIFLRKLPTPPESSELDYHLWHRWKHKAGIWLQTFTNTTDLAGLMLIWQWVCLGLQPYRSSKQNSPLFLINTSLWASLFSRVGVCKRQLTCRWIENVLIWLFSTSSESNLLVQHPRQQWKETEMMAQCLLQVIFQQFTHDHSMWPCYELEQRKLMLMFQDIVSVFRDRGSIVLISLLPKDIKGHLQQEHKRRKRYKTSMFKYEQGTKQVQGLPLRVVCGLWSKFSFLWHRWRSKDYLNCDSAMVDVLEWQKQSYKQIESVHISLHCFPLVRCFPLVSLYERMHQYHNLP